MSGKTLKRGAWVAAILTGAVTQSVRAGTEVTISGATLFESFFSAPASTNDFVDVNANGVFGFNPAGSVAGPTPFVENFAPAITASNIDAGGNVTIPTGFSNGRQLTDSLTVKYRSTGSVNGIAEALSYAGGSLALVTGADLSTARFNGFQIVANGVATGGWATGTGVFPAGSPITQVNIGVSDVTTTWGTQSATLATGKWNSKPATPGYGQNPIVSNTGYTNQLITLTTNPTAHTGTAFNENTASPNALTVFNTPIAVVPINIIANPGVGTDTVKGTDLQHLYVTGRMSTGENLAAITRSIGSGTRNATMNSLGIDPSQGAGDNLGSETALNPPKQLGASYQSTNMTGSGDLETNVKNNRLGIGYTGSDRTVTRGAGLWGNMKVIFDNLGGNTPVTPNAASIVSNGDVNNGWRIYGNESFVTVGDPNATAVGAYPSNGGAFPIASASAAKYIRNITESIAAYSGTVGATSNFFMPAQFLATNFVLRAAPDFVQSGTDPTFYVANPIQVAAVKADALASTGFTGPLVSAGSVLNGKVPTRTLLTVGTYSDGSTQKYINPDTAAATIADSMNLNDRNKVAGDFNGDGARNINDIAKLMQAAADPRAFAVANFGGGTNGLASMGITKDYAIPEILGDYNGDGNFDSKDVRYHADGLAIATSGPNVGHLDRKAGFTAVDTNWTTGTAGHPAGNYFNTTFSALNTKTYAAGDSRGDISGATATTPGAGPTGFDGIIDAKDINYTFAQIRKATGQTSLVATNGSNPALDVNGAFATILTRASLNAAVDPRADLSADMNGDLRINADDANDLVLTIVGTLFGDANLDRRVTFADFLVLQNHYNAAGGWAEGDWNGDANVSFADFLILQNNYNQAGAGVSLRPAGTGVAGVPEPTSLMALGLGSMVLLVRKRRAH